MTLCITARNANGLFLRMHRCLSRVRSHVVLLSAPSVVMVVAT